MNSWGVAQPPGLTGSRIGHAHGVITDLHPPRPAVTCVVASRNRRADLLASLPRHEAPVVLVDNASTDGTVEAVRAAHPDVTVVPLPRNAGALARTLGAARAGTPFVAFTDDDSWWAPGDLARAAEIMRAHPRLGLLAARILVGEADELDPVCAEMADSPLGTAADLPGPSLLGFVACAALVRTEAFAAVGGFDAVVLAADALSGATAAAGLFTDPGALPPAGTESSPDPADWVPGGAGTLPP